MNSDYVVIGAGSAGCIVANRLIKAGFRVLLIEAGPSNDNMMLRIPAGFAKTYFNEKYNWCLNTQKEAELNNRSLYVPRGKCIGGSGSINAMVYVRGLREDFEDWQKVAATELTLEQIEKGFSDVEEHIELTKPNLGIHQLGQRVKGCGVETGFGVSESINANNSCGLGAYQFNIGSGTRFSSVEGFLNPIKKAPNLTILVKSQVAKIEMDAHKARGVYLTNGDFIAVRQGVVISAGAIHSPQLLQVSGIGDSTILNEAGIECVIDNPNVGAHLKDHLAISYNAKVDFPTLNSELNNPLKIAVQALRYFIQKKGALAQSVNFFGGFVKSDKSLRIADTQVYINPLTYEYAGTKKKVQIYAHDGICIAANPTRPKSEGSVHVKTADITDSPLINGNFLTHKHDVAQAIAAARVCQKIANATAFSDIITGFDGPDPREMGEDELLEDFRARAGSIYHPVGTCRMATSSSQGVVDSGAKVYGTENVWVIDASIFPDITSGNTHAPTMMLGFIMAERLLNANS